MQEVVVADMYLDGSLCNLHGGVLGTESSLDNIDQIQILRTAHCSVMRGLGKAVWVWWVVSISRSTITLMTQSHHHQLLKDTLRVWTSSRRAPQEKN